MKNRKGFVGRLPEATGPITCLGVVSAMTPSLFRTGAGK